MDLNRQSVDRVIPGILAARLKCLFAETGWQVKAAKYGRRLQVLFARSSGQTLRRRIDDMSNEKYLAFIRLPDAVLMEWSVDGGGGDRAEIANAIADGPEVESPSVLTNLGGHDLETGLAVLGRADFVHPQPTVVFASTIKGWGVPFAGHTFSQSTLHRQPAAGTWRWPPACARVRRHQPDSRRPACLIAFRFQRQNCPALRKLLGE